MPDDKTIDGTDRKLLASYGTVTLPASLDDTADDDALKKRYDWEQWGDSWYVFAMSIMAVGRQYMALFLAAVQVFTSKRYLMDCNPHHCGYHWAWLCEGTKAFVRYMPLLGMVISLLVACRMILNQRIYYQFLRRGVVMDFDNFWPLDDPLFRLLLFCSAMSVLHFGMSIWISMNMVWEPLKAMQAFHVVAKADFQHEVNEVAVMYMVPIFVFLGFLWFSYDAEMSLLPLNKYFEEDPNEARRVLAAAPLISEPAAVHVVANGLEFAEPCTTGSVLRELAKHALEYGEGGVLESSATADVTKKPKELSRWRLVSTLWPAKVLLDPRLQDVEAAEFRLTWYVFSAMSLLLMIAALKYLVGQVIKDIHDVTGIPHQYEDIAGLVVELSFVYIVGWLTISFLRNVAVPFPQLRTAIPCLERGHFHSDAIDAIVGK